MAQTHRSMAYFPVLTGRDEMSKQARFIIRMALACHEAGTPYDVQWEREPAEQYSPRFIATLTATGNIPMPKPFPKAPKATRTTAYWKPNVFAEASYRTNVGLDKDGKGQSGWIVEHSSGLCLVKFGESDDGQLRADADNDPMDGWMLTHTASLLGFNVKGKFARMVQALQFAAPLIDWRMTASELKAHADFFRVVEMILAQYGGDQAWEAKLRLRDLGGPIELPAVEPPAKPTAKPGTRTAPKPAASSKLAENEARIAAIKAQLAKPADDLQARMERMLAELRANRPQAPAGKLAVTYPDGRVAYIPDPARVSA